jgi:hypothetical protein
MLNHPEISFVQMGFWAARGLEIPGAHCAIRKALDLTSVVNGDMNIQINQILSAKARFLLEGLSPLAIAWHILSRSMRSFTFPELHEKRIYYRKTHSSLTLMGFNRPRFPLGGLVNQSNDAFSLDFEN